MIITAYQLPALYEQKRVSMHEMEEIVRLLAQAPLLYDDGQSIQVQDYMGGLEVELEHEVRRAVTQLYELAVQACRTFVDPFAYEQFQDVLGLQAELWQEEALTLTKWMEWLKQISEGKKTLPEYNFTAMLGNLPEGFMIHDFYDELRYQLEQNPANTWALEERDRLYASLGVN